MQNKQKTIILQLWEESIKDKGTRLDGCSLHIDLQARLDYINTEFGLRQSKVFLDEYEIAVGEPASVLVKNNIYKLLKKEKSIRLLQNELNNLVALKEIIYVL